MAHSNPRRSLTTWLLACLALAVLGAIVLPAAAYVAGKRIVGAYEGKYGLMDYLGTIYSAAGHGELPAWLLLLSPALVVALWYGIVRIWRRPRSPFPA